MLKISTQQKGSQILLGFSNEEKDKTEKILDGNTKGGRVTDVTLEKK